MTTALIRLLMAILVGFLAMQAGGCASNKGGGAASEVPVDSGEPIRDEGYWMSDSAPMLTTIARSTTWSCVRRDGTDTIVLKERRTRSDGSTGWLTWLVSFASGVAPGVPVALDGEQAHGWLIEEGDAQRTYAVGLTGEIFVHERTPDRVVATLDVAMSPRARFAVREDELPGVRLQADVDLPRHRVVVPTQDLTIRTYPGSR